MRVFQKFISYIFHPLLIPLLGTAAYFAVTPKYNPANLQNHILLPVLILTVIIPVIAFFILQNIGIASSALSPSVEERKYPLYIHVILLLIVVYKVVPGQYAFELHYFFIGLIASALTTLFLLFLKVKASMHVMGLGSLFIFLVCLSIHFEINITLAVSVLTLITGLVATSRLYLKAHTKVEVIVGFLIGLTSQIMLIRFWL